MVPKKTEITLEKNEQDEEVQTSLTTSWRVCIDYRKLNLVIKKTTIPYHLLIKSYKSLLVKSIFVFLMGIRDITKSIFVAMIKKK